MSIYTSCYSQLWESLREKDERERQREEISPLKSKRGMNGRRFLVRGIGSIKKKIVFDTPAFFFFFLHKSFLVPHESSPGGLGLLGPSSQLAVLFHLENTDSKWTTYRCWKLSLKHAHKCEEVNKQLIMASSPKRIGPPLCLVP